MHISIKNNYFVLILVHVILGAIVFALPFLAKIYSLLIMIYGYSWVIKNKNKNHEVLIVSAYIVGAEVFLRMSEGGFISEYSKYNVIVLMILGFFYKGIQKISFIYLLYLLLLIPGIIIGVFELNYDTDIRKAIAFNISGPVCLGFAALYCFGKEITFYQLKNIFLAFCFPILSIVIYLILYTPDDIKSIIVNTNSNHDTSGGFGPNQMSTILGFGIFVFFTIFYLFSKTKFEKIVTTVILTVITFRGIITFSRGGIFVGLIMVLLLIVVSFSMLNARAKMKVIFVIFIGFIMSISIWSYASFQTNGLIDKRYANEDAKGRAKASKLSGREALVESEFEMFMESPIFGIGVGKNKEIREEITGIEAPTHNEISRLLAEHGFFGVLALIILLLTPLLYYFNQNQKQNIFVLSFYIFWILTINHAAMRLAAPAFIYALSLLKVTFVDEKSNSLPRQSTV